MEKIKSHCAVHVARRDIALRIRAPGTQNKDDRRLLIALLEDLFEVEGWRLHVVLVAEVLNNKPLDAIDNSIGPENPEHKQELKGGKLLVFGGEILSCFWLFLIIPFFKVCAIVLEIVN